MKKRLGDLITLQRGYDLPKSLMEDGNIPVAGSNGVIGFHNVSKKEGPNITIGRSGSVGKVHFYKDAIWPHNTSLFVTDFKGNNPKYIYYLLSLIDFSQLCGTSVVPSLDRKSIYPHNVPFASNKEEQDAIASVLSSLDRKISLNRKANEVLESMAKQLYDYWFVQFDFPNAEGKPYKSSGGKMVYNETLKREIPEGWEVNNLPHIAKFENGIACQRYRPKDGEKTLRVIKINEMHNGFSESTELVGEHIPESIKIYNGDVIFSWSASLEVMVWNQGEGALNQHIFKVTPNNNFPLYYIFYQLHNYVSVFRAMADARKTTMGHITQDHLNQSTIVVPQNMEICNRFEAKILPIFEKIKSNTQETLRLTSLRDYLLPLLMNGQVKVL